LARSENLDPELLWTMVKSTRMSRIRRLPFVDTAQQPLGFTIPDRLQQEIMMIDQQLGGRITFDDNSPVTESQRNRFIVSSLMEEAIASSQLEGASTVHRVAKEMLRRNRPPRDRSEQMIVNNYRAILFIRGNIDIHLTPEFLIDLQRILTENTLDDEEQSGRLRHNGDSVVVEDPYGELLHTPPDASTLPERLGWLCDFANEDPHQTKPFIHPVIRAMALHFQLAYDHPFCDGNGRTARALFYWSMLQQKYWLFEFLAISRLIYKTPSKYGRAFQYVETDQFDLTYFLYYHAEILSQARLELQRYLAKKQRNMRLARDAFSGLDVNDRQRAVLMAAVDRPTREFTIEQHQADQAISYHTARADLLNLEAKGCLERRKVGKKFVFTATSKIRDHVSHS